MPPDDSTPLGDAMSHRFSEQKIPDNQTGAQRSDQPEHDTDISKRPALPDHPQQMPADVEDEDADPVIDSGSDLGEGT